MCVSSVRERRQPKVNQSAKLLNEPNESAKYHQNSRVMIDGLTSDGKHKKGPENVLFVLLIEPFVMNYAPFQSSFEVVSLKSFRFNARGGNYLLWFTGGV